MKKIFTLISCLIIVLSLSACGTNMDGTESNGNKSNNSSNNGSSLLDSVMDNTGRDTAQNNAKISSEQAKEIALKHAGLTEQQVSRLEVDFDSDNGVLKYEVDFHYGGMEYDYHISAESGKVISVDKDAD